MFHFFSFILSLLPIPPYICSPSCCDLLLPLRRSIPDLHPIHDVVEFIRAQIYDVVEFVGAEMHDAQSAFISVLVNNGIFVYLLVYLFSLVELCICVAYLMSMCSVEWWLSARSKWLCAARFKGLLLEKTLLLDLFNDGDLNVVVKGGCVGTIFGFGMQEKD